MSISLFASSNSGSAWQAMESWRAKQRQFTDDFEAFNTNLVSTLSDAFTSTNDGLFEITVKKALAAAKARADERAKLKGAADLSGSLAALGGNLDLSV
jgi:hypothetical protein